jgi:hypothetical protein
LDVARYADTKGYLPGGVERRYPFSYTYRDYVIRAFNDDKPYDQFLIEQIAADKLAFGEDKRALAALGFLTLGRRFLNNQNDIIDDRIDVVTRGTLGLTVACARCHDHKFDPIPTKDYYALHGVFASSEEPAEWPLLQPINDSPDYQDFLKQKAKIDAEIPPFKEREVAKFIAELRKHVGDYLLGAHEASTLSDSAKFEPFAGERKLNPTILRRWMKELETRSQKPDPVFAPWFSLSSLGPASFAANASSSLAKFGNDPSSGNPVVVHALLEAHIDFLAAAAKVYTELFKSVEEEWQAALALTNKENRNLPVALPNADREALRQVLYAEGSAVNLPQAEAETILSRQLREGTEPFRNRIEALNWTHPGAPRRAMALIDRAGPVNSHVLLRGNPGNPGEEVPRHFLAVLGGRTFDSTNGSGRLELARAIASPTNPLTARVYVNRVWLHHFGQGLVDTPGDFGLRTEKPVQQDLLDYLSACFVQSGWSTKALHRLIVLSSTYRQSSDAQPATLKTDPENRLLSRMNRQRLDFEALRDTLLAVSGKMDLALGGLPEDLENEPFSHRRTVYGLIDRQNLPGLFRTFDFANPDTSNQVRFHTTVPQQALFLMNSPFVIEQARALAQRAEAAAAPGPEARIAFLYRLVYQRPISDSEIRVVEGFLATQPTAGSRLSPLEKYAQVLLLSNEMAFVD